MMEDPSSKQEITRVLKVLEALKQASHELHTLPSTNVIESDSIKALLELETESDTFLSKDPRLSTLSQQLTKLKSLVDTLQKSCGHGLGSFLTRRFLIQSISRVAGSIESEIQAWIDRESIESLIKGLNEPLQTEEDDLVSLLSQFEGRVSQGFSRELQDLVLKSKIFCLLERVLCNPNCSKKVREQCAFVVSALIRFNKDVFAGQVLMGPLIHGLVSMTSLESMKVLCSLIKSIKSPLVDEIESNGEIPKIISFLDYKDLQWRIVAMDCILEIGYFGRKEAIEAMLTEGLIMKLVELQRSELCGDLIDTGMSDDEKDRSRGENKFSESHPFASCVARFAVQLEVGEGLRQREKRAFKQEILKRVREACVSDAEAATIVAEVLWGSSP
ncbi:ARMADILLO-TYPE FOLD PROTEIN-RELATED [Salix koriyanagi]|uniref:ARMADILLO-TYPE FOLD PROTEIN-RELATED n=1 Tax=Salix koriyanagi TaxID=2511006 RepID=A0A9Q0W4T9_9ROSI|nr:ARMADILLO-TYPE FOLD PROTEIN-RELATED [Salix koriyanagi]KAJ6759040.1 ARMADILLO-TYPE FOLD PROTEIN-RELATED [Salix koriyanagi]